MLETLKFQKIFYMNIYIHSYIVFVNYLIIQPLGFTVL